MITPTFLQKSLINLQAVRFQCREDISLSESAESVKKVVSRLNERLTEIYTDTKQELASLEEKIQERTVLDLDIVEKVWTVFEKTSVSMIFFEAKDVVLPAVKKYNDLFPYLIRAFGDIPSADRVLAFDILEHFFECTNLTFGQKICLMDQLRVLPIESRQPVADFIQTIVKKYKTISFDEVQQVILSLQKCPATDLLEFISLYSILLPNNLCHSLRLFDRVVDEMLKIDPHIRRDVITDLKLYLDSCPRHTKVHLPNMITLMSALPKNKRIDLLIHLASITKLEDIGMISEREIVKSSQEIYFLGECLSEIVADVDQSNVYQFTDSLDNILAFIPPKNRLEFIKALSFLPVDLVSLNGVCMKLQKVSLYTDIAEENIEFFDEERDWNEHAEATVQMAATIGKLHQDDSPTCPFLVRKVLEDSPQLLEPFRMKFERRLDKKAPLSHKTYFSDYLLYYKNALLASKGSHFVSKTKFAPTRQVILTLSDIVDNIDKGDPFDQEWFSIPGKIKSQIYHSVYKTQKNAGKKTLSDSRYGQKGFEGQIKEVSNSTRKEAVSRAVINILLDEISKEGSNDVIQTVSLLQQDVKKMIFDATANVCGLKNDDEQEGESIFLGQDGFGVHLMKEIRISALKHAMM